jgi:hypothetical protein
VPLASNDWQAFGAQLDPKLILQQVETMGYNVLWRRALVCPNRMVERTHHDLNCTVCDGTGFLYDEGTEQKMLVSSVSLRQAYQSQGRIDLGTAMLTAKPEVALSWWDKVTLRETTISFTEVVQHTPGAPDKLKYRIIDTEEKRGVWRLVRNDGTPYTLDTDFSVDADGRLIWTIEPGACFFSIGYFIRPTYIVLDVNHHARTLPSFGPRGIAQNVNPSGMSQRTIEFPVMALGKFDFLVGTEESKL